jgi:hypothetical protein
MLFLIFYIVLSYMTYDVSFRGAITHKPTENSNGLDMKLTKCQCGERNVVEESCRRRGRGDGGLVGRYLCLLHNISFCSVWLGRCECVNSI